MGWSYGGYMTSAIVTKTKRFNAASVGAGVPNLVGMLTTDIHDFILGTLRENFLIMWKNISDIQFLFNIANVVTPSQVIHGEKMCKSSCFARI